jgi:hypothetical protein
MVGIIFFYTQYRYSRFVAPFSVPSFVNLGPRISALNILPYQHCAEFVKETL